MNAIILMGRLTRDPMVSYTDTGMTIARFSIAVDRKYKRDGESAADFFNVVSFGKQAEFVERYLKKGTKIVLVGELHNNNYTNRQGEKVYSNEIITNTIEFAESKNASQHPDNMPSAQDMGDGFMQIPDGIEEELPFS